MVLFQFAFQANGWGSEISHKLARYRFDDSTDVLLHSYRSSGGFINSFNLLENATLWTEACRVTTQGGLRLCFLASCPILMPLSRLWPSSSALMIVLWKVRTFQDLTINTSGSDVIWGTYTRFFPDKNPAQHVPLQEFTENLKDIVKYLLSIGVSNDKIIFITPPPLQEAAWEKECLLKGDTSWI